jgi:hypothetical protein
MEVFMDKKQFITSLEIFKGCSKEIISELIPLFKQHDYKEGSIIFKEDTPGENLYVICSGQVEIIKNYNKTNQKLLSVLNEKNIFVELDLNYDPKFNFDPKQMEQVFLNLLLNAIESTDYNGKIIVRTKKYEDGINLQSNISTTDSDGYFSLIIPTMSDNFSLMLYGSSKNPDWPIIKFEDIITDGIIQLGSINLGFVPKSSHITGMITTFEKSQIIATMKSDIFSYSKSFYTDSNGYFEVDLREGEYSFLILPEDIHHSKWSISSHSNIYVPQMTEYNLNLEPKVKLEGKILFKKAIGKNKG